MRDRFSTRILTLLLLSLSIFCSIKAENSLHDASHTRNFGVMLVATLDGQLVAINALTGKRLWSLKDEPVVKAPATGLHDFTFVPSPLDGSLYVPEAGNRYDRLAFTIPELVQASPCRSSTGIFYAGGKKDSWFGIDPHTGAKLETYSSGDANHRMCPVSSNATVFIGRTEYSLTMFQSTGQKRGRRWNVTYIDYSAHLLPAEISYTFQHFTSPKTGRIVTFDTTEQIFWTSDFSSAIVAIYLLKDDGIHRLPSTAVGDEILDGLVQIRNQRNRYDPDDFKQFLLPKNMHPTLYVGETSEHGLYALPVFVDANTLAGPHKSIGPLLLEGHEVPADDSTKACPSGSEHEPPDLTRPAIANGDSLQGVTYKTVRGEYILLGYHDYPKATSSMNLISVKAPVPLPTTTLPMLTSIPHNKNRGISVDASTETDTRQILPGLNSSHSILQHIEWDWIIILQTSYTIYPKSTIGFFIFIVGLVLAVVWMCGRQSAVTTIASSSVTRDLSRSSLVRSEAFEDDNLLPLPPGWIQAGQMQFDPRAELGRGCEGTIVLKGRSNARDCAVKKIASHLVNIKREIDALLKCDSHENVVRFYDYCNDGSCCYIALELCNHTVADYVSNAVVRESLKITRTEILRQAVAGMIHLHDRIKIVHRDIKPQNVLLSVKNDIVKVKISDFGLCKELALSGEYSKRTGLVGTDGWIAPEVFEDNEPLTHATDVFALGCLFGYVLTGEHPFGDASFRRQANIREQRWSLSPLEKDRDFIAINLLESMIRRNPKRRPTVHAVGTHPFFWNDSKRLQMILDVSDCIEKMDENRFIIRRLERGAQDIVTEDWGNEICTLLQTDLRSFRSYNSKSVTHLIRALRNKKNHYAELPRDLQKSLGSIPVGYLSYFTSRFPKLLIHVYLSMASAFHSKESVFAHYDFVVGRVFLDDPNDIQFEDDDILKSEDDGFTPVLGRNTTKEKKVGNSRLGKRPPVKRNPLNPLGPAVRRS